jgi:hypothetical protein
MIKNIKKLLNSLNDDDFFHYMTPFSCYNSSLKYSITLNNIVELSNYKELIELYFELRELEDDITELLYDGIQNRLNFEEYEDDQITINWIPIILNLLNKDIKIYNKILLVNDNKLLELIDVNESIDREEYYIMNSNRIDFTIYSKNLTELLCEIHDQLNEEEVKKIFNKETHDDYQMSLNKGGFILNLSHKEVFKSKYNCGLIRQISRDRKLSKLLGEKVIIKFEKFINLFL